MSGFNDTRCPKCGKRFGWQGNAVDRPPCPKCGHQLPREELEAIDTEMEAMRQELFKDVRQPAPKQPGPEYRNSPFAQDYFQ